MNKNKAIIRYGFKYPIVNTYEEPDHCVTLHADDRDLPTVNIQLPDPPDWELIDGFGLLKEEATGLRDYVANEDEASYQKFSDNRTNAWNKISELLGFEE